MILEPPKIKSDTVSTVSPSICHKVMGPDAMILVFWMLSFKPTVHGILQDRILEWVAFPFSRGSSQLRDQTHISCVAGGFFTNWPVREALSWNRRLEISAHKSFCISYYAVTSCFLFSALLCFIFRELMFLCHWANIVWQAQAKHGRTPGIYILMGIVKGGSGGILWHWPPALILLETWKAKKRTFLNKVFRL